MGEQNRCGTCTKCCGWMEIPYMDSPRGDLCRLCEEGVGCTSWEDRPPGCCEYSCVWLANQTKLPADLRPDQCGVIFDPLSDSKIVVAVTGDPELYAWRREPAAGMIKHLNRLGYAVVTRGGGRNMFLPDGMDVSDVQREIQKIWEEASCATQQSRRDSGEDLRVR